jgi:hypothetical protein
MNDSVEEKLNKMWSEWQDDYIASLRDSKLNDAEIEKDFRRLLRGMEEYIPRKKDTVNCSHPNAYYYGDTFPPTYKCDDCGSIFVRG